MSAAMLQHAMMDVLGATLRPRLPGFGRQIAAGHLSYADVLDDLMAGPVLRFCRTHPELYDLLEDVEDELAEGLADAAWAAELAEYRAHPPAAAPVGLPAYYPPITEPRDQALARMERRILGTIAEAARIGAARRELHRRREAELPYLDDPSPAAKAALTRRLHREVAAAHGFDRRIPPAPRVLVSGAQAVGKTTITVGGVAAIRERIAVRWTEPSIDKANEVAADYAAARRPGSLPPLVVRGRGQPDPGRPPGTAMCQRHAVAEQAAARGISVRKAICPACPFARTGCGYLEQAGRIEAMEGVGVFFMATAGLFVASPAPAADLLIGDERIDPVEVATVLLDTLRGDLVPYRGGPGLAAITAAHRTLDAVRDALGQPCQLAALRAAGIDRAALRAVVRLLEPEAEPDGADITGALSDAEIKARLDVMADRPALGALKALRAILREIDQPRPALNGVALDSKGGLTVSRLGTVRGIGRAGVLLLDGTGDPDLNRALFGDRLVHELVRIERDADTTGTRGRSYSRQSITALDAFKRDMPHRQAGAGRLRREVATIAARQPGPCLVVANMDAEAALAEHLPPDTPTGHFGKLRGLNTWEGCESAVQVGQVSLSVRGLEDIARAYLADDPAPFISSDVPAPEDWPYVGWPYVATRMRRMRDGSLSPVEVPIHPDPRVQRVYEQIREAELVQALDRTRPVFNHRTIVAMNSLVLDLTYDRVLTHAELVAGGTRWDRAWAAAGILPLGVRDLHALHRALFPSESSAKEALKAAGVNGGVAQIGVYLKDPPIYRYRLKGQRGPRLSQAFIDPVRHPDPRAALSAALDCDLVWFEAQDPEREHARQAAPVPPGPPALAPAAPARQPALAWPGEDDGWPGWFTIPPPWGAPASGAAWGAAP